MIFPLNAIFTPNTDPFVSDCGPPCYLVRAYARRT